MWKKTITCRFNHPFSFLFVATKIISISGKRKSNGTYIWMMQTYALIKIYGEKENWIKCISKVGFYSKESILFSTQRKMAFQWSWVERSKTIDNKRKVTHMLHIFNQLMISFDDIAYSFNELTILFYFSLMRATCHRLKLTPKSSRRLLLFGFIFSERIQLM